MYRPVNASLVRRQQKPMNRCDPQLNDVIMKTSNEVKTADDEGNVKEMNQAATKKPTSSGKTASSSAKVQSKSGNKIVQSNSRKLFESLMILPALFMASIISVV